jgi:hypothetical protein
MTLKDFLNKSKERYREQGPAVIPSIAADFTFSAISRVPVVPRLGTNVFERDWDVLIILDACRLDQYRDLVNPDVDSIWSVGSSSNEWMSHTFARSYSEEIKKSAYVTGNPFSDEEVPDGMLGGLDEVWRTHWDDEIGGIKPDPITDRVIHRHRLGHERVIGHYMQPHYPFIGPRTDLDGGQMNWDITGDRSHVSESKLALWDQFLYGVRNDLDEVKQAYDDNLRFIWRKIQVVLENVEGKVVITADHGNALGELGMWGHKPGMPHPQMRRVPWDIHHCTDEKTHQPEFCGGKERENEESFDRDSQLEDLGYL